MRNKYEVCPYSRNWLKPDDYDIAEYFNGLGFRYLKEILDMRVFDLMNMNRLDAIRVEEILVCLYKFLNRNPEMDKALFEDLAEQTFDYGAWRKKNKNYSDVLVSDLVLADGIYQFALEHLYDLVRDKFFHSDEYNWKEYRFRDRDEYMVCLRLRKETNENEKNRT